MLLKTEFYLNTAFCQCFDKLPMTKSYQLLEAHPQINRSDSPKCGIQTGPYKGVLHPRNGSQSGFPSGGVGHRFPIGSLSKTALSMNLKR